MFTMGNFLFIVFIIFTLSATISHAQQQYSKDLIMRCNNSDEAGPSPAFLYTCISKRPSCKAFLMFRTKPPYISPSSISNLSSSNITELAYINNISSSTVLPPGNEVIVPVTCSCSGQYYQANATYVIRPEDTYFTIAHETYQGLTTCDALMRENPYDKSYLSPGLKLQVPLRCACPSQEQIGNSTNFLLTYLVTWNDTVPKISERFNVSPRFVEIANGFSDENPALYPFTTILIPLPSEPSSSQMRNYNPTPTSYPSPPHRKSYKWIYAGIGIGAALAIICFLAFLAFFYYRRQKTGEASLKRQKLPECFLEKVVGIGEILKIYTYEELEMATDKYSPHKRLGSSVYRGIIRGKLLAIKKMSTDVSKEIKILGNINHFNLISLYGVCEHEKNFYLVYEYLEGGSLKDYLHEDNSTLAHSWSHRILIALDVANGLNYLHNCTDPGYVHKDINSQNILLNNHLRAKIANFGLARENGNSHTSHIVGQKGYLALEYAQYGCVTTKTDVYAFGVVLLELVTGNDAVVMHGDQEVLLSETMISALDDDNIDISALIDPRLQVKHPLGFVIDCTELPLQLLKLSAACLAREHSERLSMDKVVSALMKIQADVNNSQSFSIG